MIFLDRKIKKWQEIRANDATLDEEFGWYLDDIIWDLKDIRNYIKYKYDPKATRGQRLKAVLHRHDIKQFELADKVGISMQRVSAIIRGNANPSDYEWQKIAKEAGCNLHWLMTGEDPEPKLTGDMTHVCDHYHEASNHCLREGDPEPCPCDGCTRLCIKF